jgi:hypothetical protein
LKFIVRPKLIADDSLANSTSLLSLPDELLSVIFDEIISELHLPEGSQSVGIKSFWTTSQRIFALAHPLYYKRFIVCLTQDMEDDRDMASDIDALALSEHPEVHPLINRLTYDISHTQKLRFPTTLLPLLTNLKHLHLVIHALSPDTDNGNLLSDHFISILPRLSSSLATLSMPYYFDDDSGRKLELDLAHALPSLRTLQLSTGIPLVLKSAGQLTSLKFGDQSRQSTHAILALVLPQLKMLNIKPHRPTSSTEATNFLHDLMSYFVSLVLYIIL